MTEAQVMKAAGLLKMRDELQGYIEGMDGTGTAEFKFAELHIHFHEGERDGGCSDWTASHRVPKSVMKLAMVAALAAVKAEINAAGVTP